MLQRKIMLVNASEPAKTRGYERRGSDDLQQELLLLVSAGLAAVQNGRPELPRGAAVQRRSQRSRRTVATVTFVSGALSDAQQHQGVGHAGDCGISARDFSTSRIAAQGCRGPNALSCRCRRDALGLCEPAF